MAGELTLTVVIPTRNEAAAIPALLARLAAALAGVPHELRFVDDSDDDTAAVIERLAQDYPAPVICLVRGDDERGGGLSTAVVEGLRSARGRWVCVMDSDLQHPPELIASMLDAAVAGAELVVASRYTEGGSSSGLGGGRRVVSRLSGLLAQLLFAEARRTHDPLSGFFLCRRVLIDGIEFRPIGFKILLELLVCVPDARVEDVPLRFQPRAAGVSKANLGQGILYLRHLRSLFFSVRGSARLWKFALVGTSGLAVFLPLLWLFGVRLGVRPLLAFLPAWLVALAWNTALNRVWTLADRRRRTSGEPLRRYLLGALAAGALIFVAYALLIRAGVPILRAGLGGALLGMAANGLGLLRLLHGAGRRWGSVAVHGDVQAALGVLAAGVGADRAYLLPPRPLSDHLSAPAEILLRAVRLQRAAIWIETASPRPQRRSNVEVRSVLIIPVIDAGQAIAVVICERVALRAFDQDALGAALGAVERLRPAVAAALGR